MNLIILGAGTGIPSSYLASPSIALLLKNQCILFDMGPGTLRQLARIGVSHENIDQVFLTHFHPDHSADIVHLLFATKNPAVLKRRRPITITGPAGIGNLITCLQKAYDPWLDLPPEMLSIHELDIEAREERDYGPFKINSQSVMHTDHSLAYRVELNSGENFVYSGDTEFCDGIIELAHDCDILIMECSFPEGQHVKGHLTPSQAGQIAAMSNTKKLVLVHFYPEILGTDIAKACREVYIGELVIGRDFLQIEL